MAKKDKPIWNGPIGSVEAVDMPKDKWLRTKGFMTTDEFIDLFATGAREYMAKNWPNGLSVLHHPEDLTSTMLNYAEAVFWTVSVFGVAPREEE